MVKVHQTDEEHKENTKPIGDRKDDHLFATVKSALKGMVSSNMN
jgi:hypothetical protein